jgi:putative transcriptional regulator
MRTLVLGCLLVLAAGAAQAQPLDKPLLLVASPTLRGAFSQTALVAVPIGDEHLGFILNRATKMKLATLFPDHAPSAKVVDPVYYGGPEMPEAIFALVPRNPGPRSLRILGELFVVGHTEVIDRIIERTPNEARYYTGFVAWQAGELAREIDSGYWYVTDPEPELFFRPDTSGLWEELVIRLGNGHPPQRGLKFQSTELRSTVPGSHLPVVLRRAAIVLPSAAR